MREDDDFEEIVRAFDPSSTLRSPEQSRVDRIYGFSCMACPDSRTEAQPKTRSDVGGRGYLSQVMKEKIGSEKQLGSKKSESCSFPVDIISETPLRAKRKVRRELRKRRSFSTDFDRDEAWERKRDLHLLDNQVIDVDKTDLLTDQPIDVDKTNPLTVGRSASDCRDRILPGASVRSLSKTGSLTDEDLEELRGCIDLGFGFKSDESCDLKGTLPALELYYAINRHYVDAKSRSSPISPLDGAALHRTYSGDSSSSPLNETWRIACPGDHPTEVKTRLRHWAQAVACLVKQGFSAR